ncbi:hypothetical protein GOBAR_DD11470 [Gossypium barbadense]|nr:hypothetical protein GOBAR_DD11470 [Gossypium barbadense]
MEKTYYTFVNKMIYFEFNDGANRDKLPCYLFKFEFVLFSSFAAVKTPTHFLVFFNCLSAMLELEKQGWGDLLHVFERVEKWSEDWRCNSRIVWLSYYEMPFHAWKLNLQEEESTNLEVEDDDVEMATTESKVISL